MQDVRNFDRFEMQAHLLQVIFGNRIGHFGGCHHQQEAEKDSAEEEQ